MWNLLGAIAALVLLAYLAVTDWVPLFPWNDVAAKLARAYFA